MKYLPLGFSIASFLAASAIALTTSAQAGLRGSDEPAAPAKACRFASNQDCGANSPAVLR